MAYPTLDDVERVFEAGDACDDCPFLREIRERMEFWGAPCTRVEYECDVLNGADRLTPWNCQGVDAGSWSTAPEEAEKRIH